MSKEIIIPDNRVSTLLFSSTRSALFWLVIRVYVGYAWLTAGVKKVSGDAWTGESAGKAIEGFVQGALAKASEGKDVQGWYAFFLENVVLPNASSFSYLVAWGEVLVGLGLILGCLTGIAAFFGGFMNVVFLLAGTVSSNPILFVFATWLVLAWKVAGWYGLDRWALPYLGTPWQRKIEVNKKMDV
ncbi:DoxX family protein [Ammoniphilus resinae]|uniref:Thiosulfate dehydrogenase [quinone] large subunit n=1 Tax=Ammoniphilus resinae TaxID=861532 RepID=A0ABS4GW81_9BACL|nr:thiosulfate dehydrogenase [quinone] large subunit [Ammoniphilus resinae]